MQAVILAGGQSRRLGGVPKAGLMLDGQTLLARTVDAAARILALEPALALAAKPAPASGSPGTGPRIAVVGPVDSIAGWLDTARSGVAVAAVQEDPPYSGPAAGIAAGVAALPRGGGHVLVLACDMPHAGDVAGLLTAEVARCAAGEGVMAVTDKRKQPLAAIYPLPELRDAVAAARTAHRLENASVFSLLARLNFRECAVSPGMTADIDTWQDARAQGIGAGPADPERAAVGKSRRDFAGMDQEAPGGL